MSEATQKSRIPDTQMPGSNVLILSSDRGFIDHHRAILVSIGFTPITAPTLEAALAVLRLMVIELVIVDEETGPLGTQRILKRAGDGEQNVPVLVVGRGSDGELQRQARELGAVGYLDRPAFQDDVVRALLAHCARWGNALWEPHQN